YNSFISFVFPLHKQHFGSPRKKEFIFWSTTKNDIWRQSLNNRVKNIIPSIFRFSDIVFSYVLLIKNTRIRKKIKEVSLIPVDIPVNAFNTIILKQDRFHIECEKWNKIELFSANDFLPFLWFDQYGQ
ncbi:MAG: hypothetical protein Q8K26_02640, partial [Candidatus Gracilibacteria bacterium]|nr:hypothetical protein [Candidatus Gracilibacteria bacterium]